MALRGVGGTHARAQLIDHVVRISKEAYAGTTHENDFIIYHDALSQWWERGAQEYMKSLGFEHRQLRCVGNTNAGTRYHWGLVGDSPEICRALDSHGFADLAACMRLNCALSTGYPVGDPRLFNMGTPSEVWRCMARCWSIAPTSAHVMEDIEALPDVLDKIIEADGCVVKDLFLRTGRRARRLDNTEGKRNARPSQRKATVGKGTAPRHPDCDAAHAALKSKWLEPPPPPPPPPLQR